MRAETLQRLDPLSVESCHMSATLKHNSEKGSRSTAVTFSVIDTECQQVILVLIYTLRPNEVQCFVSGVCGVNTNTVGSTTITTPY
jgi:hypothetical protein